MTADDQQEEESLEEEYEPSATLSEEDRARIDSFRSRHATDILGFLV